MHELKLFVVEFRQLLITHFETPDREITSKLAVMFGILQTLESGPLDVQTIRQRVAILRGERITAQWFIYAMDVLSRRGNIVNGTKLGFWKLGALMLIFWLAVSMSAGAQDFPYRTFGGRYYNVSIADTNEPKLYYKIAFVPDYSSPRITNGVIFGANRVTEFYGSGAVSEGKTPGRYQHWERAALTNYPFAVTEGKAIQPIVFETSQRATAVGKDYFVYDYGLPFSPEGLRAIRAKTNAPSTNAVQGGKR
jgi:hypothetical protein